MPADGKTIGDYAPRQYRYEGVFKNPKDTAKASAGGWFHSGDLAVMHPDGYAEVKDRSKDIIISGGENIAVWKLRKRSISTPILWKPQWWPVLMINGVRHPVPSSH